MKTSTEHRKICFLTERRGLFDDRAYWKQALALKKLGFEVHYLVISHYEESFRGVTPEGILFQIFEGKKIVPFIPFNYLIKKFLPMHSEFDELLGAVNVIQPKLIQIVDLRILRLLDDLKGLASRPKIVYDIREPRDLNLLDLRMKNWKIPLTIKKVYADYIQKWEYKKAAECDYILGVDDGIGKRIKRNLPQKDYTTLYNFTDLSSKREFIPLSARKYDASYIGGLSEIRGAKTMVQAAKIIASEYKDFKLLLLGKAHSPELENWLENFIQVNNLEKNIKWIKGVDYQNVSEYYNQTKIGLNPLHYAKAHEEIIQIKLFEYMNYGIPIVTSNFGEMRRYIVENQTGECIEPNSAEILSNTIVNLLNNSKKMEFYSQNGYSAVDEKYNWKLMEEKYVQIIKNLLVK